MYKQCYSTSRSLVIGIDAYKHASPLSYAVSDARTIAELLISDFGFMPEHVRLLVDHEATKANILREYLAYTQDGTDFDDRIIIFFAGHGHTVPSLRGEVGYLVPHDGDPDDLSTLIRWDELTRNADLIAAKHLLFIMDACYGGLAVTRSFHPGSMRFLSDMMQRSSRQVLTAGKADEVVADAGGPLPNHSIFTGHLIEALQGKAKDNRGNLTATGVISYVYTAVSQDHSSQQTPHYGHVAGDGDMVFLPLDLESTSDTKTEGDVLMSVPVGRHFQREEQMSELSRLKELLSEGRYRIQLFEFMVKATQYLLAETSTDFFALDGPLNKESFAEQLLAYEQAVKAAVNYEILISYWGDQVQTEVIRLPVKRLADRIVPIGGTTSRLSLRWYPVFLLMYSSGLGAVASENYGLLYSLFHTPMNNQTGKKPSHDLISGVTGPMTDVHDLFKWIPGHDRYYTARSEYLYKLLQPPTDDVLFVGAEYEDLFDRFELMYSLEYALHRENHWGTDYVWGPIGRFGWRGRNYGPSPLQKLISEAQAAGERWKPLQAGLFGGSIESFNGVAQGLEKTLARLEWF